MAWAGGHRDPTPPCNVTGASCGDFLADEFRELCFAGNRGHQCRKTRATHSDLVVSVVHDREAELAQHHEGRDPVSVSLVSTGLCVLDSLFLRFSLNGFFHRAASQLAQDVVVVAERDSRPWLGAFSQWAPLVAPSTSPAHPPLCAGHRQLRDWRPIKGRSVERRDRRARARANFRAHSSIPKIRHSRTCWRSNPLMLSSFRDMGA